MALKPVLPGGFVPVPAASVPKAFRAHLSTNQNTGGNVAVQVNFDTADFDQTNGYNEAAKQWKPGVVGTVAINVTLLNNEFQGSDIVLYVYKNAAPIVSFYKVQDKTGQMSTQVSIVDTCGVNDVYQVWYQTGGGAGDIFASNGPAPCTLFEGILL